MKWPIQCYYNILCSQDFFPLKFVVFLTCGSLGGISLQWGRNKTYLHPSDWKFCEGMEEVGDFPELKKKVTTSVMYFHPAGKRCVAVTGRTGSVFWVFNCWCPTLTSLKITDKRREADSKHHRKYYRPYRIISWWLQHFASSCACVKNVRGSLSCSGRGSRLIWET